MDTITVPFTASYHNEMAGYISHLVGGWALPLWKIWVRQLGRWHSQYMESHNPFMFQSPPTSHSPLQSHSTRCFGHQVEPNSSAGAIQTEVCRSKDGANSACDHPGVDRMSMAIFRNRWIGGSDSISGWWCLFNHLEKWWSSSMGRIISYILENETCSKPPTRYIRPIFYAYVRGYTPKIWPEIWY